MSEEIVLKSTLFGGYDKNDVMQYIDKILQEKENIQKELQETIEIMLIENNQLKKRVDNKNEESGIQEKSYIFDKSKGPIRRQMDLPEGTYVMSGEDTLVSVPIPRPVYQTKKKNTQSDQARLNLEYATSLEIQDDENYLNFIMEHQLEYGGISMKKELECLQNELDKTKETLRNELQEKLLLKTKFNYANELLVEIYKK